MPEEGEAKDTIVLLNGALASAAGLKGAAKHVSQRGFRVALLEWPGHGARAEESMSSDAVIQAVHEVVTSVAPEQQRVIVFGYSMGGFVAQKYAAAHPGNCYVCVCVLSHASFTHFPSPIFSRTRLQTGPWWLLLDWDNGTQDCRPWIQSDESTSDVEDD